MAQWLVCWCKEVNHARDHADRRTGEATGRNRRPRRGEGQLRAGDRLRRSAPDPRVHRGDEAACGDTRTTVFRGGSPRYARRPPGRARPDRPVQRGVREGVRGAARTIRPGQVWPEGVAVNWTLAWEPDVRNELH